MSDIPIEVIEALKELGMDARECCWRAKNMKTWAVKHYALERIAALKNIRFSEPNPLSVTPDFVALSVLGTMGDRTEWSIGEASASTTMNKYLCAMAEKRAKDRVILKLIGIHGIAYGEDEADSFNELGEAAEQALARAELLEQAGNAMLEYNLAVRKHWQSISAVKDAILADDVMYANQLYLEFTEEEQTLLFGRAPTKGGVFETHERAYFRTNESNAARKELING